MSLIVLFMLAGIALVAVAAFVLGIVGSRRREPTVDWEQTEKISQEIGRINAMETAGRITPEEAAELKQALEGRKTLENLADLPRQRLTKSRNRVFSGICGGVAEWVGWDATVVRTLFVLCALFAAPGVVILYIILEFIMPPPPPASGDTDAGASASGGSRALIALVVLGVLAFMFFLFSIVFRVKACPH